jgi:hypothetical protein
MFKSKAMMSPFFTTYDRGVCVCVCVCVCTHARRSEEDIGFPVLSLSALFSRDRVTLIEPGAIEPGELH